MNSWRRLCLQLFGMFSVSLGCLPILLPAEIMWVKVLYKPESCNTSCYPLLERRLNSIESVSRISCNFVEGSCQLFWKPNVPYDDRKVRNAVAWVGIGIRDVRLKIRGTIEHDDKDLYIVSIGDGTKMPLLSPCKPEEGRYLATPTRADHTIEPALKERLLLAERNHETVTLEGVLVMPFRPPVHLQIESAEYHNSP